MYRIECGKLFEGCPGVVSADSEDGVMELAAAHAAEAHGVTELDDATVAAVRGAIETS